MLLVTTQTRDPSIVTPRKICAAEIRLSSELLLLLDSNVSPVPHARNSFTADNVYC